MIDLRASYMIQGMGTEYSRVPNKNYVTNHMDAFYFKR